ncbi:LexA family transcriptional regulator [Thorsellia anophelis]|uniref:Helix-turn-helix n=1 Tax=Thorsellia anophelis DSM 18579 TaxID=1123402 RepID=A0A1H9Y3X6_9GAMM|nr:LexA family transcriptional regulator [Thorsellia anophelis]SES63555.1 Helix-turn-helix [Thorsellia anophelis DSM 18579]
MSNKSSTQKKIIQSYHDEYNVHDSFPSRLKLILKDTSYSAFSKQTGLSDKSIRDYVNGKTTPNLEKVKLFAELKNCSVTWLAFGIGPKDASKAQPHGLLACEPTPNNTGYNWQILDALNPESRLVVLTDIALNQSIQNINKKNNPKEVDYEKISYAAVDNLNRQNKTTLSIPFNLSFIESTLNANPDHLSVFEVISDSMTPMINPQDHIIINHIDKTLSEGIYLIYINGTPTIRHIQQMTGNRLNLSCSNPNFTNEEVDKDNYPDEFQILGKVIWVGKIL